jgi:hypothetical protein
VLDEDGHPLPESPFSRERRERDQAVALLALLLSAVSNEEYSPCASDPCPVCTAAEEAQSFLNDLRPDRPSGWWWVEDPDTLVSEVARVRASI